MSDFKEIGPKNPILKQCPVCGKKDWCCTAISTHAEYGESIWLYCNRDTLKQDVSDWKYMGDSKNAISKFLYKPGASGRKASEILQCVKSIAKESEVKRFNDEKLSKIYSDLLSMLSLTKSHADLLSKGGINRAMQEHYKIKSFPSDGKTRWGIMRELAQKHDDLTGLPGACIRTSKKGDRYWDLSGAIRDTESIIFPIPNHRNQIVMLQQRFDDPSKVGNRKYQMISSAKNDYYTNGCSPSTRVGFVRPLVEGSNYCCYLTEGIKKAYVGANLLGSPIITIQGVNSWAELTQADECGTVMAEHLRDNFGVNMFIIALDNDKYVNKKVMESQKVIIENLKNLNFKIGLAEWDSYMGKGLDDMLLSGYKPMYFLT